jgi:hypothetical protein
MLHENYTPTDLHAELRSAFQPFVRQLKSVPAVGAYGNGLLAVVDEESSTTLLASWSWLIGKKCRPLVTPGFGDVFFCDSEGVSFVEVQRGTCEFVDSEIAWFLSDFLVNPDVVERVLRKVAFDQLVVGKGPLKYHNVFILEPWAMLGGVDRAENYTTGKCSVYLDLVGQSLHERQ